MLADYAGNYHGYQVDPQVGSAGQQQRIIILWDLLKVRAVRCDIITYLSMLRHACASQKSRKWPG